jgi:hypothetical protein
MKNTILKTLAAGAIGLAATSALAYDNATVFNAAHYPVNVEVRYSACRTDSFTVPAATPNGPGKATAGSNRMAKLMPSSATHLLNARLRPPNLFAISD